MASLLPLLLLLALPSQAADTPRESRGEEAEPSAGARVAREGEAQAENAKPKTAPKSASKEGEQAVQKSKKLEDKEEALKNKLDSIKKRPPKDGGMKNPLPEADQEPLPDEELLPSEDDAEPAQPGVPAGKSYQAPAPLPPPDPRWERDPVYPSPEKTRFTPKDIQAPERRAAAEKASKMADGFRSAFKPAQEPPASSAARNLDAAKLPSPAAGRSPDPSKPSTAADLALAGQGPYRHAFELHGLKPGADAGGAPAVLRKDGSLATQEERESLSRFIRAEPAALMRRPDLFSVLPREKFVRLKNDQASHPERPQYRHVALSAPEPRDFVWSESCAAVSGECNPAAAGKSYQRGEYVSPEALARIWDELDEELEQDETVQAGREAEEKLSRRALADSPFMSRLRTTASRLFGSGSEEGAPEPAFGSPAAPPGEPEESIGSDVPAREAPAHAAPQAKARPVPGSPEAAPARARRALWPWLAALAGVLLVFYLLKKRLTP